MRFKNLDLMIVILLVMLNVGWLQLPTRPWFIGIVLAAPLAFVLPGYALTQVLFERKLAQQARSLLLKPSLNLGRPMSASDYITLTLGLSIAMDVLVGFILNLFPTGLQAQSWILSLGVVTAIFVLIAVNLRRKESAKSESILRPALSCSHAMLFGLAILVAIAAIGIALVRPPTTQAYFTQFWLLPSSQTTTSCTVAVGIQNFEADAKTYQVVVTVNDAPTGVWQSVTLARNETWERRVPIHATRMSSTYIEAKLYTVDEPETAYREVHMTLGSVKGNKKACTY